MKPKIAKEEKAYAIKIDPDVEVEHGTEALKNLRMLDLNIKGLKKDYQKTIFNLV